MLNLTHLLGRLKNGYQKLIRYYQLHIAAFKTGFRNIAIVPISTLITISAIGMCLAFPMSLYLIVKNVQTLTHGLNEGSAMSVYVNSKCPSQALNELFKTINRFSFIEKTTYLTPEEALVEFKANSNLSDTLALLPENPLPGVIHIIIDSKAVSSEALTAMKELLAKKPYVENVILDYEWAEKLRSILNFGKALAHLLYLIIGVGVILMVGNTLKLALERHKEEIEVLDLIGATSAFIRRPFLYRGILYGGLGGIMAILVLIMAGALLKPFAREITTLYGSFFKLQTLNFMDTVSFITSAACLGWLGAAMAFSQQPRAISLES